MTTQNETVLTTRNAAGQVLEVIRGSRRHLERVAQRLRVEAAQPLGQLSGLSVEVA